MATDGGQTSLPIRLSHQIESSATPPLRRLRLLDLPIDVLNQIVKHITHTNDLTAIALAHSALHSLAIPHIYNRFDIVWPDGPTAGEPRGGVDALTYGLATLNMAEDVFGEADWQREKRQIQTIAQQGHPERQTRRRRGNCYARYIRKFSLGNGPPDWVEEYLTHKEAGKMLGTLVALAIARMKSLESFVWDMPTGIICDVWTSLSYLGDDEDGEPSRLSKLWVRWHRNTHLFSQPPASTDTAAPYVRIDQTNALTRTEHPSFSILSPLRSLSVLDIDEMQYLDEMSVLIGRSLDKLRVLRVGVAVDCRRDDWTAPWSGDNYEQIDLSNPVRSTVTIGGRRRGGILGVLTSSFVDLKQQDSPRNSAQKLRRRSGAVRLVPSSPSPGTVLTGPVLLFPPPSPIPARQVEFESGTLPEVASKETQTPTGDGRNVWQNLWHNTLAEHPDEADTNNDQSHPSNGLSEQAQTTEAAQVSLAQGNALIAQPVTVSTSELPDSHGDAEPHALPSNQAQQAEIEHADLFMPQTPRQQRSLDDLKDEMLPRKLSLTTLELEWVPLSIPVLQAALDWSKLTSITLLDCKHHDELWVALHEEYAKDLRAARGALLGSPRARRTSISIPHPSAVRLRLKHIHTNTVTLHLIRFINECLAPNTLESLYFQDLSGGTPVVSLEVIFNGVVKLHRQSLHRLLIDSCKRRKVGRFGRGSSWKRWAFTPEQIKYITTPTKMPMLQELGFCIDYHKDWHLFKQRLPALTKLRSLYIPRYSAPYDAPTPAPMNLAMQLLDAVLYNDDMELCYVGIYDKCFEIMEGDADRQRNGTTPSTSRGRVDESSDDDEEEDEDDDDDDDDEDDEEHLAPGGGGAGERRDSSGDFEYVGSDDEEEVASADAKLHIREILFYDDKVRIFRVRHGKL